MCLRTENIKGEVNDKPIKCYKVYRKTKEGKLESYFKHREYDLKEGDEVIAEGNVPVEDYIPIPGATYSLSSGFIHAFRNEEKCMSVLKTEMNYMILFGIESLHMRQSFENCEGVLLL